MAKGKPQDHPVARALINPVSIALAAGAATAAIAIGSIPLAAAGGIAYLGTVVIDAFRRRGSKQHKPKAIAITVLPDPDDVTDQDTRNAVAQIIEAKSDLQKVLDETPPDVIAGLSKTLASLDELESYAIRLVARAEDISRYVATIDLPELVGEVKQLATRAGSAKEATVRATFEQAKNARMDEIRSIRELRTAKEQIDANLMRVVAVLCALPTKIVHMRALDAQAMDRISGDMHTELEAVGNEIKTSEAVIKELGKVAQ